jgi:oxygen-independent coproporphyrinogen-3 oxidase
VLSLNPDHMSCYGLKLEPGTPMYEYRNYITFPDDDAQADMYLAAVEILKERGFRHYEISNFARRGKYSRHNMKYWTGGEYLGFGPSASSDFADKRFTLIRDLAGYINGIKNYGEVMEDIQDIPLRERAGEYLMLRLRTSTGIRKDEYEKMFMLSFEPLEEVLKKHMGYYYVSRHDDGRWTLTPKGYLVSNSIISDLLLAQEDSQPLRRL